MKTKTKKKATKAPEQADRAVTYSAFLDAKAQLASAGGFEPTWLPDYLKPHQRYGVEWAVRTGRAALYYDCGLGKTPMQYAWAENVVRHTNRPVLVATTLGDSTQAVRESAKFQVEAVRCRDGKPAAGARVVVTNYEKLHLFDPTAFAGFVANESSCLKDADAKRVAVVNEFARRIPYRLLATATAAPNDYHELGSSSEVLGGLGFQDMLSKFFKKLQANGHHAWGRVKYRLRGHAERDFWRWVCSWARACRKPSDLGFPDDGYALPALIEDEVGVTARSARPGYIFDPGPVGLSEEAEERRRTTPERAERAAELVLAEPGEAWACWGRLNAETSLLTRLIPGAVEVKGGDSDERKEEMFEAFSSGQLRVIVTKPEIAGHGLNWQHCARLTVFPTHSFERYYQLVRRFWRFGQERPVRVRLVVSGGQAGVLANLRRKQAQAEVLFDRLVSLMADALRVGRPGCGSTPVEVPSWLA